MYVCMTITWQLLKVRYSLKLLSKVSILSLWKISSDVLVCKQLETTILCYIIVSKGASAVTLKGGSVVTSKGNSAVTSKGNSAVTSKSNSAVTSKGNSGVTSKGNSGVTSKGDSVVTSKGGWQCSYFKR